MSMNARKILAVVLGVIAIALIAGMGAAMIFAPTSAHGEDKPRLTVVDRDLMRPMPRWMLVPCKYEDSMNCYYDARTNGHEPTGHSHYSIRVGDQDCIVFWQNRYARKHNRCY